jgi:hypothetical protein
LKNKMDVHQAKAANQDRLMAAPGVVGVGVGRVRDSDAILVFVAVLTADNSTPGGLGVPEQLEGFPVVVREIGHITAQR